MTSQTLRSSATKLLEIGKRINRLSRQNTITSETQSIGRENTNGEIEALVDEYNEIGKTVTNETEFEIDPYVITETVNSSGQRVVTATNK